MGEKVGSGPLAQVDFRENILNFLEQLVLKREFGGKGVGSDLIYFAGYFEEVSQNRDGFLVTATSRPPKLLAFLQIK